jgi:hypothetical protein
MEVYKNFVNRVMVNRDRANEDEQRVDKISRSDTQHEAEKKPRGEI